MALSEEQRQRKNKRQAEYNRETGYRNQKAYDEKHKRKNMGFMVLSPQDDDIIEWLGKIGNKSGYIKSLIREDMEKNK